MLARSYWAFDVAVLCKKADLHNLTTRKYESRDAQLAFQAALAHLYLESGETLKALQMYISLGDLDTVFSVIEERKCYVLFPRVICDILARGSDAGAGSGEGKTEVAVESADQVKNGSTGNADARHGQSVHLVINFVVGIEYFVETVDQLVEPLLSAVGIQLRSSSYSEYLALARSDTLKRDDTRLSFSFTLLLHLFGEGRLLPTLYDVLLLLCFVYGDAQAIRKVISAGSGEYSIEFGLSVVEAFIHRLGGSSSADSGPGSTASSPTKRRFEAEREQLAKLSASASTQPDLQALLECKVFLLARMGFHMDALKLILATRKRNPQAAIDFVRAHEKSNGKEMWDYLINFALDGRPRKPKLNNA